MFKHLILLISLLVSISAHAIDNLQVGGFIYATEFSQNDWYNGRNILAVNLDYDIDNFAVRTQVQSYNEQHIRRLVLEYATPVISNVEFITQVGRFSRVDALFNGVTDSPASYQMSMMPNAGYSYRMFNGSFVIMNGATFQTSWRNSEYLIKGRYSVGKADIPSQEDLATESFKRQDLKGINAVKFTPELSEDIGLILDTEHFHAFASRYNYKFEINNTGSGIIGRTAATMFHTIHYRIDRGGIRYDNRQYWLHQEWFHDYTWTRDARRMHINNQVGNNVGSISIVGYYLTDAWRVYAGKSHGRGKLGNAHNVDEFLGVTWNIHPYTVSLESHRGEGFAWRKYDAPYVRLPNVPQIDSLVLSMTYVF